MRPTAVSQLRQYEKRPSVKEEKLEEPEFTEEQQSKWDKFLHKNSVFAQQRETHLEDLRRKKEEQDIVGCTFEPQKLTGRKIAAPIPRSSLFDRARLMEAKKEARMAQIRQELFDKEMAQCSFHPNSRRPSSESAGECMPSLGHRPSMPSVAYQDEAPKSNSYANGGGNLRRSSSLPSGGARRSHATPEETSSGSEYWEGNSDGGDKENSQQELTILPVGPGGAGKQGESPPRPPKLPGHNAGGGCRAFEEARQLKVMQRLQERRQLLQETLTPDGSSPTRAAPFRFDGIVATKDIGPNLGPSPAAAVAEAVERMEDLLLGDFGDLSDLEDSSDEEEDDHSKSDNLIVSSEAPVWGGNLGRAPLVRPSRVGD